MRRDVRSVTHCNRHGRVYPMNWFRCMVTVGHKARVFAYCRRRSEQEETGNGDRRMLCTATQSIDAGCGGIRQRGVSDGSDRAHLLWRSRSAWIELFFVDVGQLLHCTIQFLHIASQYYPGILIVNPSGEIPPSTQARLIHDQEIVISVDYSNVWESYKAVDAIVQTCYLNQIL